MERHSILLPLTAMLVGIHAGVPVLTQYPKGSEPYIISDSTNITVYQFNCSVTLNSNTNNPEIHWRSNRTGMENISITAADEFGVKAIKTNYNQSEGTIWSRLELELTLDTQDVVRDTEWQCILEYSALNDSTTFYIKSDPVGFFIEFSPHPTDVYCSGPCSPIPWFVIIAIIIVVCVLVIVIGCVIYRRRKRRNREAGTEVDDRMSFSTTKEKPSNKKSEVTTSACTTLLEPESV